MYLNSQTIPDMRMVLLKTPLLAKVKIDLQNLDINKSTDMEKERM